MGLFDYGTWIQDKAKKSSITLKTFLLTASQWRMALLLEGICMGLLLHGILKLAISSGDWKLIQASFVAFMWRNQDRLWQEVKIAWWKFYTPQHCNKFMSIGIPTLCKTYARQMENFWAPLMMGWLLSIEKFYTWILYYDIYSPHIPRNIRLPASLASSQR